MKNTAATENSKLKARVAELESALALAHGCLDGKTSFEVWERIEKALPEAVQQEIAANDWGGEGYVEPVQSPSKMVSPTIGSANVACSSHMLSALRTSARQ